MADGDVPNEELTLPFQAFQPFPLSLLLQSTSICAITFVP